MPVSQRGSGRKHGSGGMRQGGGGMGYRPGWGDESLRQGSGQYLLQRHHLYPNPFSTLLCLSRATFGTCTSQISGTGLSRALWSAESNCWTEEQMFLYSEETFWSHTPSHRKKHLFCSGACSGGAAVLVDGHLVRIGPTQSFPNQAKR